MEEGRSLAAKTAETTWPGSEFVAGVARYSSGARDDRPERLTYYYRNDGGEVLRISFIKADRLAVEVRKYESEDEIDFTPLKALPANLISYDAPLRQAEQNGGFVYRQRQPGYLVRVILTWPSDREAPVYVVTYNPQSGPQGNPLRVCCFDARTGEAVDSLIVPRATPPWPVPAGCATAPSVFRQVDRFQGYFVQGSTGLAVGSPFNLNYQGDNFLQLVGGQGTPRLEAAANTEDISAQAEVVNAQPNSNIAGQSISFATLRLPVPGCWKVRISVGTTALEYTLYAYPWDCRPQHERFPPVPGVTPRPCAKP